jgi:hypothetical protein
MPEGARYVSVAFVSLILATVTVGVAASAGGVGTPSVSADPGGTAGTDDASADWQSGLFAPVDRPSSMPSRALQIEDEEGDEEGSGEEGESDGERDEEDEEGVAVLGEWWGLGGEASEAPYVGLVELGVVLLAVGMLGYSAGKRTGLVPNEHRRRLLQLHEWTVLAGVALTVPHFVAVEEWEGVGLVVAILLAVEVASGVYGRHLHRYVVRMGRGDDSSAVAARLVGLSNRVLFRRWRRVHVLLTVATAASIALHVVTAVGE